MTRPSGYLTIIHADGKVTEGETLSCVHCQRTWRVMPGSDHKRGWCFKCGAPTCGSPACSCQCLPWERRMEIIEQRHRLHRAMEDNLAR